MNVKKYGVFLTVALITILNIYFIGTADAAVDVSDIATEINSNGEIIKGTQFEPDKPIFRPMYQGDYQTIFEDAIGPQGTFTGYYDPADYNNTVKHAQSFKVGDTMLLKNIGTYQGRKVALQLTFQTNSGYWKSIGIYTDGSISLENVGTYLTPVLYQLVYDEPGNPVVENIYLDLPTEVSTTLVSNTNTFSKVFISPNVKKNILLLSDTWVNKVTRKYSLGAVNTNNSFVMEMQYYDPRSLIFENDTITDNNQPSSIALQPSMNIQSPFWLLKTNQKTTYVPNYLPVRVNGQGNSAEFEANYDIGQTVSDTYPNFFPESLKIVAEDQEGYFKKLDQESFVFKDKDGKDISDLVTVKKVSNSKLEFELTKASLQKLKTNQVNVQLSLSDLIAEKVLNNYDAEKELYNVPLTFYNVRTKSGIEKQSENTVVNATITPNLYGDPIPTKVFVGTSTNDLDPNNLIKNGVTTIRGDSLDIEFVGVTEFTKEGNYDVPIRLVSNPSSVSKVITVPVTATKGIPITSAFFENQSWLINEINRQLSPKKIDIDVYEMDLLAITNITLSSPSEKKDEHIPVTINALINLTNLSVTNQNLIGVLPKELGDLTQLTQLVITGNQFDGGIPETIGNLKLLQELSFSTNQLSGQIPKKLAKLPMLQKLDLQQNKLSGQLPEFPMNMQQFKIGDNQITYNAASVPDFLLSANESNYENTFIKGLTLAGNEKAKSKNAQINPFDDTTTGYFNLKATGTETKLFEEHTYTIKDTVSGEVYYTGKKDNKVTIPFAKGISYTVILDGAEQNSNNVFSIQGKEEEFKFETTPAALSITARIDGRPQPAVLDGDLAIFDNRDDKNWKLSITPSVLIAGTRPLKGEYSYTAKNGENNPIMTGQKFLLETGESDSVKEVISVSDEWDNAHGLSYTAYQSNYTGAYKGSVNWTLEDAP